MSLTRADRLALLLSLIAVLAAYIVADRVFEQMPHLEDEIAYVWQADAIAGGRLTMPSPPDPHSFLVPFVVDLDGQRFGKYPLGWPVLLAVGVIFGVRSLVNPLLAGLTVWLTYRLGKRVFGETVGLLTALLTLTSPFFLMNSGSLLAHPLGLVLSTAFALFWLNAWDDSTEYPWLATLTSALCLGGLAIARPYTALGVSLPFVFHGIYVWVRAGWGKRRRLLAFVAVVLALASLHFMWQFAVTGSPWTNPYTLWWEYDRVGFGPGYGRLEQGHSLSQARVNTKHSLFVGWHDLFGWGRYSWIFIPFGLLAILRHRRWAGLLLAFVFPCLVIIYLAYWIGSSLFGPRYFYEGLYSLTLLSGAGIAFLAGWPTSPDESWRNYSGWRRARPLSVTALVVLLLSANLFFYTPIRLQGMHGLYGISQARLDPFLTPQAQEFTPALVIVHADRWTEYGALLELQDPFLDTPFLFVISRGQRPDSNLAAVFSERSIIHYYPDEPNIFYTAPRPNK